MRQTSCTECEIGIEVQGEFGPLPLRCKPCNRAHASRLSSARAKARRARSNAKREVACTDCQVPLTWSGRGRPRDRCDPCRIVRNREENRKRTIIWIAENPERVRETRRRGYLRNIEHIRETRLEEHYRRKYGITRADRDRMLAEQNGLCRICSRPPHPKHRGGRLAVDHCHVTKRVRGLLCANCNTAIGLLKEDPALFAAAAAYLAGGEPLD